MFRRHEFVRPVVRPERYKDHARQTDVAIGERGTARGASSARDARLRLADGQPGQPAIDVGLPPADPSERGRAAFAAAIVAVAPSDGIRLTPNRAPLDPARAGEGSRHDHIWMALTMIASNTRKASVSGRNTFHPNRMSWSYR